MKKDITTIEDIQLLVDTFYTKAKADETIGHFFNEVIELDLEEHLPKIYRFWESILFGKANYRGNPMLKHIDLHQKSAMTVEHFDKWITLWEATTDEYFEGTKATEAKTKAKTMKELMLYKIKQSENPNFIQ